MSKKSKPETVMENFEKEKRRRKLRKANKYNKRNREDRAPRRKQWAGAVDNYEDILLEERVMPRDEGDRKRAVENSLPVVHDDALHDYQDLPDGIEALVIEVSSGLCRVRVDDRVLLCNLRGALTVEDTGYTNVVAVGDTVIINETDDDKGVVEYIMPRRNLIARPDPFYTHLQQVLVTNVDQLLIVASWRNPSLWPELVDRYLITAQRHDIEAVLCVNKIDLADDIDELNTTLQPYYDLGDTVLLTSATTGAGLDDLRELLDGKTSVLAGLSGVGKSSLLTAVQPGFELRTADVNEDRGQGRHTTTQATMLPFGDDGYVIDTPGIREFGLYGLHPSELVDYYPELAAFNGQCRFHNCTHIEEPGCALRAAVEAGQISALRYKSYAAILTDLKG